MTVNEIFSELSTRQINGMMVHESLMNAFRFLSLPGYAKCQEYHYLSESIGHIRLLEFAMDRYSVLIPPGKPEDPEIIPVNWYQIRRQNVPLKDKPELIASAFGEWIKWELDTLTIYEAYYKELFSMDLIDAANFVNKHIDDVSGELIYAKNERLSKESMNYDMPTIISEQEAYEKRFTKKLRKLKEFK